MITLTCPKCLTHGTVVRVDVSDGKTLSCADCEESYELEDLVKLIESWTPVLPWLKAYLLMVDVPPAGTPLESTGTVL